MTVKLFVIHFVVVFVKKMKGEDRGPLFLTFPLLGKDRGGERKKRGGTGVSGAEHKVPS